jgi:hypothetical protein
MILGKPRDIIEHGSGIDERLKPLILFVYSYTNMSSTFDGYISQVDRKRDIACT